MYTHTRIGPTHGPTVAQSSTHAPTPTPELSKYRALRAHKLLIHSHCSLLKLKPHGHTHSHFFPARRECPPRPPRGLALPLPRAQELLWRERAGPGTKFLCKENMNTDINDLGPTSLSHARPLGPQDRCCNPQRRTLFTMATKLGVGVAHIVGEAKAKHS